MIEQLIRNVLRAHRGAQKFPCPEAEVLATYVDRSLSGAARDELDDHLATCEACLDQVLLCTVGSADTARPGRFDAVIRFLEDTVELLRGVGEIRVLPGLALVATRGTAGQPAALKCVRFDRQFGDLTVEVAVEARSGGLGEIRVAPTVAGALVEDLRVTLLDGAQELDSSVARGGSVAFDEVEFGDYVIRLSRPGRVIGEVSLRLEAG